MSRAKIYVARAVSPSVLARLGKVGETHAWEGPDRCPDDVLEKEVADADVVLGTHRWTAKVMDKGPRLRLIALTSVGFDMVDMDAATKRGILVTNTPDVLTDTVADLTLALMLAAGRRIAEMDRWLRAGQWKVAGITPMAWDIHHATLGIIGLGRIGSAVAHRALAFQMDVLYYDTVRKKELEKQHGYRFVDQETLLREADFVTLHVPLEPETKGMMGAAQLALMKPTAFLINTSRGPVVDERALIKALQESRIAGAGLDVFEKEPLDMGSPLLKMENVVILPHVGSATEATRTAMLDLAVSNVVAVLQGKPALTPVNPEVGSRKKK
ncbi:MAG TPA: D-glycerate dehydrogenase [Candidatus Methylomirabilis sp.]|nr:D-glycerate dehydrogenase [Candidatus Methylomirabilis sp.]